MNGKLDKQNKSNINKAKNKNLTLYTLKVNRKMGKTEIKTNMQMMQYTILINFD